ncbi:MAG: hypothetical protein ABEI78_00295 [Candidatus Nanohaloarchaea archaeon]
MTEANTLPYFSLEERGFDGSAWVINDSEDLEKFLDNGLDKDLSEYPFEDEEEALEFIMGEGMYSENNSFFFNEEDASIKSEYFDNLLYCPECLEEIEEGDKTLDDINPVVDADIFSEETNEYRIDEKDENKYILFYCPKREHRSEAFIQYQN